MGPDEALFREHLEADSFQVGLAREKWGLEGGPEKIIWPAPIFWVQSHKRFVTAGRLYLQLNLSNYPQQAPTGCPWNIDNNGRLDNSQWPKGGGNVSRVFNPGWNASALYAPCDRIAMNGHDAAWKDKLSAWWWTPTFTFVRYLEFVHITLNPYELEPQAA